MGNKEKIVNMCGPDEEGIVVLQDAIHNQTAHLRTASPDYKPLSYGEIADRIRMNRRRFFQILGLRSKPSVREGRRMKVPKEMMESLTSLYDRITAGEEEMKLQMDEERVERLRSVIEYLQEAVLRKFRKTMSINEIERRTGIENLRLVNVLKPSTRECENPRYLSTHEIQRIFALHDMIEAGTLPFTDIRGRHSGKDLNPFKLVVTKDDVFMIRWLKAHSDFTDRRLEEVLGLPAGKITQIIGEVHRQRPRLACEALRDLIILVEAKIEEMQNEHRTIENSIEAEEVDGRSQKFERLEELEAANGEIGQIIPSMEELRWAVVTEIHRKEVEEAA